MEHEEPEPEPPASIDALTREIDTLLGAPPAPGEQGRRARVEPDGRGSWRGHLEPTNPPTPMTGA